MLDGTNEILYCLDEGIGLPNSTLTSFKIKSNGSLAKIHQLQTLTGPVASVFYSATQLTDRKFFAVVHYSGSAVTTYSVDPTRGHFEHCQTFTFTIPAPGTVPSRQEASHPHGVVVDPTGQFVLVPDLGADLVRIFQVNPTTGGLEEQEPFAVAPGSGPRHAVFWTPSRVRQAQLRDVRFYLVSELDNHLRGYDVKYSQNGTISFSQFYDANTYGGATPPTGSKAAEIAISPENNHLVISNRNDNMFGPGNDSIAVFSIASGWREPSPVSFLGLYPAYGSFPRQFDMSQKDVVALALQSSQKVAVAQWNRVGMLGPLLVEKSLDGEISSAIWDI
ncbi:uncharacterized protein ATNIH1004_005513 [Aspergillus tanneri]|uniref:Uncharacterized protein n=1 Tax=Aspergillus tanneri TaxID=1220188 RepID=A0A5M9MIL9_9EURO|nr:uncharacterized protein ATNIH1004_005513 [Aspergillus tanneri]KAA8646838.1 hypothetical protein ATNIH1004_005513 [Aspergillus tanneri]